MTMGEIDSLKRLFEEWAVYYHGASLFRIVYDRESCYVEIESGSTRTRVDIFKRTREGLSQGPNVEF